MTISIEVPVFKGEFLQQCIDSVLRQTSDAWQLSLVWDGGDALSHEILKKIETTNHPKIRVFFNENQGIAKARAFLSSQNDKAYILPLDDDDELAPHAVECFIEAAKATPWASLIRGKRGFINQESNIVEKTQWFPFGPRTYFKGMVTDVFNQAQPYLIRKSAYNKTLGWRGFDDFMQAGEDCDIFLQVEEVAHFELVDEILYYYRIHDDRASNELTSAAAFEMWRRLADDAVQRMELPLIRTNEAPPFTFIEKEPINKTIKDIAFIVQHKSPQIQQLKAIGIDGNSIIETQANAASWRMEGFQVSRKKLVCFVKDTVTIHDIASLTEMIAILNETNADIIAPSKKILEQKYKKSPWLHDDFLLVKRTVLLATTGFDHDFIPENLQGIDFCIQARRRDFSCYEATISGITHAETTKNILQENDLTPLKTKWYSHPELISFI
ncbi:glycosyltransferase [uncultured Kordia sp.]|uniref:glycosyltransferase n=1 Tax=uncultured Kordia sp. TaxID=507699 RepID=UPI00262AAE1F|nr:glycosyltransferase [uncultured Kordia sp.]